MFDKFLEHLGINKKLMVLNMQSRISDCEKPYLVKKCKKFGECESARLGGCRGCNVWNYLYDITALQEWCKEQNIDFMVFTMQMQRMLKQEADE